MSRLADHHRKLLSDSAISDEVAAARGCFTATKAIELRRLGFSTVQAIVPSLVIPIRGLDGDIVSYQARPDQPRIVDGKPCKYESPAGSVPVLDVPVGARDLVRVPPAPIWITEGARKTDAAVTAGLACVSLPGVWSWVSKIGNAKTVLPDLLRIRFADRKVVIAFDSDCMSKAAVHAALEKLAGWLESQGAWVHCCYLPAADGEKVGLDDFLAPGHSVDRLWEYVEQGVRPLVVEPKGTVMPTAWLLGRIENLLCRFVRFTDERGEHEIVALALFVLHSWALDGAYATPYLHVKSPAKRAGKTRLLEVLALVCRNAIRASSVTGASIFQLVELKRPTLLIDEVDSIFGARSEHAEVLRGVLNDGYRPGGVAIRGTQDGEAREFSTWCPKVLCGLENNSLPDTVTDRCIVITLERKLKSDAVERLRERRVADQAQEMRERLEDWGLLAVERLSEFEVETIPEITDREEDIWEPLLAVADAGAGWPERARAAVLALSGAESGDEDHGLLLLAKLRDLFAHASVLSSKVVCEELRKDPELPFGDYRRGDGINVYGLSRLLKPYGIGPHKIRIGEQTIRGYRREQLEPVWGRYLPAEDAEGCVESGTSGTPEHSASLRGGGCSTVPDVPDSAHPSERPCANGTHPHGVRARGS
jgi:Protein of unknown function (DUF3631)/Domain of unknown function (DUF3854)